MTNFNEEESHKKLNSQSVNIFQPYSGPGLFKVLSFRLLDIKNRSGYNVSR
jgi:hypothetical protein